MIKLFINVWPDKYTVNQQEFTEEYVKSLLSSTEVETTMAFDSNDAVSMMFLDQADNLQEFMQTHGLIGRVGIVYNLAHNYPGWSLFVETDSIKGSINLLVSKFFRWERVESQSFLSFDEILGMQ